MNVIKVKSSFIHQDELGKVIIILDKDNKLHFIEYENEKVV